MSCERYQLLMTAYLDGEIGPEEKAEYLKHLEVCRECAQELSDHRQLKEITSRMEFIEPEDRIWETYWSGVYNQMERRAAWVLMSLGAVLLLSWGTYRLFDMLFFAGDVSWVVRIGVAALIIGFFALMASVIREQAVLRKADRYKDIKR